MKIIDKMPKQSLVPTIIVSFNYSLERFKKDLDLESIFTQNFRKFDPFDQQNKKHSFFMENYNLIGNE